MIANVKDLTNKIDTASLIKKSLVDWRPILSKECQVFVFEDGYIAKRFDQINFKLCTKDEAKEILIDNLYALLRYKYFPQPSEDVDERIKEIISSFVANLKTTLKKVSFDATSDAEYIKLLPSSCIAFRNGVFDFKANNWLFKYDIIKVETISNIIYSYSDEYAILWYLNIDFEPFPIDINKIKIEDFIDLMKSLCQTNENLCFELAYNMCHTSTHLFSLDMFKHLSQIIGYTILQSFSQNFVMFVGSGQNGKNSLFDGCFVSKVIPRPAANDLDEIEKDRFITGSLENRSHNIFLETGMKTYEDNKMLKAITGSMYQTIQNKGQPKYSSIINCKFIFSANDQEKLKFSDTTPGFRRRFNVFELWYKWDSHGRYLKRGDYYSTTFSDDFIELKQDINNSIVFIYLGMFGIFSATRNFTRNFEFDYNDWNLKYSDVDLDLRDKIEQLTLQTFVRHAKSLTKDHSKDLETAFFDINKNRLYKSDILKDLGYNSYDDMISLFDNEEAASQFFTDNDIYISAKLLQRLAGDISSQYQFTSSLKKIYNVDVTNIYNNQSYVKCTFFAGRLKLRK